MLPAAVEPAGSPLFHVVGRVVASPRPGFEPEEIILGAQRAALAALGGRPLAASGGRAALCLAPDERARLVALALRVIAESADHAEAECRRIVASAQAQAAAIVQDARDDGDWLARRMSADGAGSEGSSGAPEPDLPLLPHPRPRLPAVNQLDEKIDEEIGGEFFASFEDRDEDPWGFMDDDPVGVAPALLRRVLRRPTSPRRQPVGRAS